MEARRAVEILGSAFLRQPGGERLRCLERGELLRQLGNLVYRLVFQALAADLADREIATKCVGSRLPCPDLDTIQLPPATFDQVFAALNVDPRGSDELGRAHEALLGMTADLDDEGLHLSTGAGRWARGAYYTPDRLIECLLDHALEPALDAAVANTSIEEAKRNVLNLRILDPAVGSGRFLAAAASRLSARLASTPQAFPEIVERCLYGVDLDPVAVEIAKLALWLRAGLRPETLRALDAHLKSGNSLVGATAQLVAAGIPDEAFLAREGDDRDFCQALRARNRGERRRIAGGRLTAGQRTFDAWCAAFTFPKRRDEAEPPTTATLHEPETCPTIEAEARKYRFFHYPLEFDGVAFDIVLGNPPFGNAIERSGEDRTAPIVVARTPSVGGTADLAFRFLAAATEWVRPGGWIGFVQPRAALNARSLEAFRAAPPAGLSPRMLAALDRADLFSDASVFVSLIVLGPPGPCLVPLPNEPPLSCWISLPRVGTNWFLAARGTVGIAGTDFASLRLEDRFEVVASMTAADAYCVAPLLADAKHGQGPQLVTTGLIDPGRCLWGERSCRYLRRTFTHPRITLSGDVTGPLYRRLLASRRPKVLVAGLASRIEAFLDERGQYQGAVSTYTLFHPEDDIGQLRQVCDFLNRAETSERFRRELGANALGGGSITVRKEWLKRLPLEGDWDPFRAGL